MLKPDGLSYCSDLLYQPPSGGCVLKRGYDPQREQNSCQPPSGGCVLKQTVKYCDTRTRIPAAFRRLCVETSAFQQSAELMQPAAFRRLCVETTSFLANTLATVAQPPSGGCVLKPARRLPLHHAAHQPPSGGCVLKLVITTESVRINNPAAFRRLCVET